MKRCCFVECFFCSVFDLVQGLCLLSPAGNRPALELLLLLLLLWEAPPQSDFLYRASFDVECHLHSIQSRCLNGAQVQSPQQCIKPLQLNAVCLRKPTSTRYRHIAVRVCVGGQTIDACGSCKNFTPTSRKYCFGFQYVFTSASTYIFKFRHLALMFPLHCLDHISIFGRRKSDDCTVLLCHSSFPSSASVSLISHFLRRSVTSYPSSYYRCALLCSTHVVPTAPQLQYECFNQNYSEEVALISMVCRNWCVRWAM